VTRSLAVDGNNDLFIDGANGLAMVAGLAAAVQNCETAVKTLLNEMIFAQGDGLPYFEALWTGIPDSAVFEAALHARLLAVQDVTGIVELTTRLEGNAFKYDATISTIYGEGTLSG
jgi:hypothetical protein